MCSAGKHDEIDLRRNLEMLEQNMFQAKDMLGRWKRTVSYRGRNWLDDIHSA